MLISVSRILLISSALAVGLATPTKRTVGDITACIKTCATELTALTSACQLLSSATPVTDVLAIGSKAAIVSKTLVQCLATVTSTPSLTDAECKAIYAGLEEQFGPKITASLGAISAKKDVFAKTPGAITVVSADLKIFSTDTGEYLDALAQKCPSIASELEDAAAKLKAAFAATGY